MAKKQLKQMTLEQIITYCEALADEERAASTVSKYRHDLTVLCTWLDGRDVTKALLAQWKEAQLEEHVPSTVNAMLAAVNGFFRHMRWGGLKMKYLRMQHRMFCDKGEELTYDEYKKLLDTALRLGKNRLALVMETLCALGLRVSELRFITVEAIQNGTVEIRMKGKIRTVALPPKLQRKLCKYAKRNKIASGEIFITESGKRLSRGQIWREMKRLSEEAGVEPEKVFPHNLRHLFARRYYQIYKNIKNLADILGHSSLDTTRIYLISSVEEHARQMEQLGLVR